MDSHLPEVLLDVAEVLLLRVEDLLLLLVGGAAEGGVLVAGEPVPLEVTIKLEQNGPEIFELKIAVINSFINFYEYEIKFYSVKLLYQPLSFE
jgi:hypothetical protein